MSTYIHFTDEQKKQARQTDLVSLLRSLGETLKRSGKEYEWKDGSAKVTIRGNLWYLYDRANKNGECWPAIPTIASELKLSQSTVRRDLRDLRKAGLLETEQRYRTKGGKSSLLYKIQGQ